MSCARRAATISLPISYLCTWALAALLASGCGAMGTSGGPPPPPPPGPLSVELVMVATGFVNPVDVQQPADSSGRLFVVEQAGRIRIIQNGSVLSPPFLDITSNVESGGEEGLLGLAFHPRFAQTRRFFVHYTRRNAGVIEHVISEFQQSAGNANVADPTEHILLVVSKLPTNADNHNAGQMVFGPDTFLYIGFGDGGGAGDQDNNAQNPNLLLGKLIRIDVDTTPPAGQTYVVPPDNPFLSRPAPANAIWADGLRNPWRFSFDTGVTPARLFVADVGQDSFEEIDLVTRGGNYGWHIMEGFHCFSPPTGCNMAGLTLPIFEYNHSAGDDSITGGFVYRGTRSPQMVGTYVFGDFISGRVWGLQQNTSGVWQRVDLLSNGANSISSFGQDQTGEIYLVDYRGTISRIRQVGTQ